MNILDHLMKRETATLVLRCAVTMQCESQLCMQSMIHSCSMSCQLSPWRHTTIDHSLIQYIINFVDNFIWLCLCSIPLKILCSIYVKGTKWVVINTPWALTLQVVLLNDLQCSLGNYVIFSNWKLFSKNWVISIKCNCYLSHIRPYL